MQSIRRMKSRYVKRCLGSNILLMLILGGWPLIKGERNLFLRLNRIVPYFALFGFALMTFVSLCDMFGKLNNFELLSESVIFFIEEIKAITRLIIIVYQIHIVIETTSEVECFAENLNKDEENIFQSYKLKAQRFTLVYVVATFMLACIFFVEPLFDKSRRFPGGFQFPFDAFATPFFELIYAWIFTGGIAAAFIISVGNAFVISCIIYTTGNFKILQRRFENARKYAEEDVLRKMPQNQFKKTTSQRPSTIVCTDCVVTHLREDGHELNIINDDGRRADCTVQFYNSRTCNVNKIPSLGSTKLHRYDLTCDPSSENKYINVGKVTKVKSKTTRKQDSKIIQLIKEKIRATKKTQLSADKIEIYKAMERHLARCVNMHVALIKLIGNMQEKFRLLLFLEIALGATITAIALFQIGSTGRASNKLIVWTCVLCHIIQELFTYCWTCSEVAEQSVIVSDAMYFSDWTEASMSYRRTMQIVMSSSLQPVQLRGASFLPFTMETFINVVNSGYSYFNMVSQIDTRK